MHLLTLSPKQASILLPFLLSLPFKLLASDSEPIFERELAPGLYPVSELETLPELEPRGSLFSCCIGKCPDDDTGNMSPTSDGPTSDRSPGIGIEFEAGGLMFASQECNRQDTYASKGAIVGNRQGTNWALTADNTPEAPGSLVGEYILDGTKIKIGANAAAPAASAVALDIISWNPSAKLDPNTLDIEGSNCNPWTIVVPVNENKPGAANIKWAPQITAPMPLEAISDIISKGVADQTSPLLPAYRPSKNLISVTSDFFQSSPHGITSANVKADVLGFFSLLISYAKAGIDNYKLDEDESVK